MAYRRKTCRRTRIDDGGSRGRRRPYSTDRNLAAVVERPEGGGQNGRLKGCSPDPRGGWPRDGADVPGGRTVEAEAPS
jgi:hypothetical protein